jgi:hypothetical protein
MANNIVIDSTWVRDRFNLQYNNVFSNQAPGLVDYEISMYLTMAHIEIIDEYSASLDLFEKYRSILTSYMLEEHLTVSSQPSSTTDRGIEYQTFEFTENYWRILKEYAKTISNTVGIPIKPITYDGFNTMSQNPFKKPNGLKGWRLDINADPTIDAKRDVKIMYKRMSDSDYITEYDVVYLTTPKSFDLESDIIPNSLDENPFLCEKVINRSVELATRDYRDNTLQSQVQINKRSE